MSEEVTNTLSGAAASFNDVVLEGVQVNGEASPVTINIGGTCSVSVTGGVPNSSVNFSAYIYPDGYTGTKSWSGTFDSSGNYTSPVINFDVAGTYFLTFEFGGSSNKPQFTVNIKDTNYTETVTVSANPQVNQPFTISVTGGAPNSPGLWIYNPDNVASNVVDNSGNYRFTLSSDGSITLNSPGYPNGFPANGNYEIELTFNATQNSVKRVLTATGGSPPPVPTPSDTDNTGVNATPSTPPVSINKTVNGTNSSLSPTVSSVVVINESQQFYQTSILKFKFKSNGNYFAENASSGKSGFISVITRCETSKLPSEIYGVGMEMGNISGIPSQVSGSYTPNPTFPSTQALTWFGNKTTPTPYGLANTKFLTLANPGSPPTLLDNTLYDITISSIVSLDKTTQTIRYVIESNGSTVYDSGNINDPNRTYDPSFNGVVLKTTNTLSSSTGWTLDFTDIVLTLSSPANTTPITPAGVPTPSPGSSGSGGGNGNGTTGSLAGMMAVIQGYINQANEEILNIYNRNKDDLKECIAAYNYAGSQLAREQQARFVGIPPVPSPVRAPGLNRVPTTFIAFVDALPEFAQDTRPHMYSQTLEAISDFSTVGGQSVVGLMRESRNQARLNLLGTTLDNNIPGFPTTVDLTTLISNGTIADAPNGINNYTPPSILVNNWPPGTTVTSTPVGYYNTETGIFNNTICVTEPFEISPLTEILSANATGNATVRAGVVFTCDNGTPTDDGGGAIGTLGGSPVTGIVPPTLNTNYTSSSVLTSAYSIDEAIEQVIHCNCECWLG